MSTTTVRYLQSRRCGDNSSVFQPSRPSAEVCLVLTCNEIAKRQAGEAAKLSCAQRDKSHCQQTLAMCGWKAFRTPRQDPEGRETSGWTPEKRQDITCEVQKRMDSRRQPLCLLGRTYAPHSMRESSRQHAWCRDMQGYTDPYFAVP